MGRYPVCVSAYLITDRARVYRAGRAVGQNPCTHGCMGSRSQATGGLIHIDGPLRSSRMSSFRQYRAPSRFQRVGAARRASACVFLLRGSAGRRLVAKLLTRGGGHATDSARNSLRQERKAKRICRSESVFLATDCSMFCSSVMACSSMRTRSPCLQAKQSVLARLTNR